MSSPFAPSLGLSAIHTTGDTVPSSKRYRGSDYDIVFGNDPSLASVAPKDARMGFTTNINSAAERRLEQESLVVIQHPTRSMPKGIFDVQTIVTAGEPLFMLKRINEKGDSLVLLSLVQINYLLRKAFYEVHLPRLRRLAQRSLGLDPTKVLEPPENSAIANSEALKDLSWFAGIRSYAELNRKIQFVGFYMGSNDTSYSSSSGFHYPESMYNQRTTSIAIAGKLEDVVNLGAGHKGDWLWLYPTRQHTEEINDPLDLTLDNYGPFQFVITSTSGGRYPEIDSNVNQIITKNRSIGMSTIDATFGDLFIREGVHLNLHKSPDQSPDELPLGYYDFTFQATPDGLVGIPKFVVPVPTSLGRIQEFTYESLESNIGKEEVKTIVNDQTGFRYSTSSYKTQFVINIKRAGV